MKIRRACMFCVTNPKANGLPVQAGSVLIGQIHKESPRDYWAECQKCAGRGWVWVTTFTPEERAFQLLQSWGDRQG